jgi:hypothetical protein
MAAPMERLPLNTFEMRIASHDNRVACGGLYSYYTSTSRAGMTKRVSRAAALK